ncbi:MULTISPECIES: C1 family peptidase [unclassified Aureispira]|uniref:C1 family peptidase n=1 Tax=unclassified Aureispira TaxID=2649989 RepID=UPI00069734FB|nr:MULTISPECIES: C1 family peptidase [unclassified Aureispira]WMX17296.1 C1 family peptidase [Aureispira sp. CCB-E]
MKHFILPLALVITGNTAFAQYKITPKYDVVCTEVKNQERTGTCWSFATSSFLESEVKRTKKMDIDLSEMFSVRATYMDKAQNYILRQGKANYSEGSLSHDVINAVERVGLVPEAAFSGKSEGVEVHNHGEMISATKGMLDGLQQRKTLSPRWKAAMNAILDIYMGDAPEQFKYDGKEYTPKSFAQFLGIKGSDYISLTSYTHHPFYQSFVLEIPDNYSNGSYQNVPMEELEQIVDNAIQNGFSVAWDGDVSEATFSHKEGLAILPQDPNRENLWDKPDAEIKVTQELRQSTFESKSTTDDHLMHLVGIAYDTKGTKYYKIKNSWGTSNTFKGYLYMSQAYFQLKTVGILVHKEAIPKTISKKFQ